MTTAAASRPVVHVGYSKIIKVEGKAFGIRDEIIRRCNALNASIDRTSLLTLKSCKPDQRVTFYISLPDTTSERAIDLMLWLGEKTPERKQLTVSLMSNQK